MKRSVILTDHLEENSLPTANMLGVLWNVNEDTLFNYSFTPDMEFTKRNVLKKTATIYDPLGFLAPYVVRAKLLIQQAWITAADWDDPLPDHHQEQWKSWFQESTGLDRIRIPRCLTDIPQQSKPRYTCFQMLPRQHSQRQSTSAVSIQTALSRHALLDRRHGYLPYHYSLRSGSQQRLLPTRTDRFSKFVTIKF